MRARACVLVCVRERERDGRNVHRSIKLESANLCITNDIIAFNGLQILYFNYSHFILSFYLLNDKERLLVITHTHAQAYNHKYTHTN